MNIKNKLYIILTFFDNLFRRFIHRPSRKSLLLNCEKLMDKVLEDYATGKISDYQEPIINYKKDTINITVVQVQPARNITITGFVFKDIDD